MRTSSNPRGFTLLEMLVVIAIFAMLLGLTVVFLQNANKDLGVTAAARAVASHIRGARQKARHAAAPAWVILDAKEGVAHQLYSRTEGEWHFEDDVTTGAFGEVGKIRRGTIVPGRVGQGIRLGSGGVVDCGEVPVHTFDQGISMQLWFNRRSGSGTQVLCAAGDQAEIGLQGDRLYGEVGRLRVDSGNTRVVSDLWHHVHLLYANEELTLYFNGKPIGGVKRGRVTWGSSEKVTVGSGKGSFSGIIDEFRVGVIIPRSPYHLTSGAKFDLGGGDRLVIKFDEEGRLDGNQPLRFGIASAAAREDFIIGLGGTLDRWSSTPEKPDEPKKPASTPSTKN